MKEFPLHKRSFKGILNFESVDFENPYNVNQTHRHNYFEVILFSSGGGNQIIDFKKTEIKSNQISIILPKQIHSLKRDKNTKGIVIQFSIDSLAGNKTYYYKLLNFIKIDSTIILDKNRFDEIFTIIKLVKKRFEVIDQNNLELIERYLFLLLAELFQIYKTENNFKINEISSRFLELLEDNFVNERKITDYSSKLGISSKSLNNTLLKHLGKNTIQLIHERMIIEIKRLCMDENLSLKEIAYRLNFDSQATFTRFVKKHTSELPTELKASVAKIHN